MRRSAISSIDAPPPSYSEHPMLDNDDSTMRAPAAAPIAENEYLVKRNISTTIIEGAKKIMSRMSRALGAQGCNHIYERQYKSKQCMPQTRQQTQFAIEIYFLAALKAACPFSLTAL
jgi:hypothetical protein